MLTRPDRNAKRAVNVEHSAARSYTRILGKFSSLESSSH